MLSVVAVLEAREFVTPNHAYIWQDSVPVYGVRRSLPRPPTLRDADRAAMEFHRADQRTPLETNPPSFKPCSWADGLCLGESQQPARALDNVEAVFGNYGGPLPRQETSQGRSSTKLAWSCFWPCTRTD